MEPEQPLDSKAALAVDLARRPLIQIPGPNPILTPGASGKWDGRIIESADILKDHDTYYLYYHGAAASAGYQLGVATASHPLGPWRKHEGNPVLRRGEPGAWDSQHAACGCVLREGVDRYFMWYSGRQAGEPDGVFHVGLATASSPLGPWTKHPANPIIPDFGYVGGVFRNDGIYWMYNEYPIGSTGRDYGPLALATATAPEGPWTRDPANPVLEPDGTGGWDDGGFSEAKVTYRNGLFHVFYGGAKLHPTRILSRESIGYAVSHDGRHFIKHCDNPVAVRERQPDAAAFAEVHALFEHPLIYLFHTLRTNSRDGDEDIGVQVLATQRPFSLRLPLLTRDTLASGEATALTECPPVSCEHVTRLALTVECTFARDATADLSVEFLASADGLEFDTEALVLDTVACTAGQTVRRTICVNPVPPLFVKVVVSNPDPRCAVVSIRVGAVLGG